MYSLEGALKLRDAIKNFQGGTVVVGVCRTPYKCPAAPYELSLLMEETMRRARKRVDIQLFTPEPYPVPAAGSVIAKQVERLVTSRGIKYLPKTKLVKVERDRVAFEDGSALKHDLFVAIHHPAHPEWWWRLVLLEIRAGCRSILRTLRLGSMMYTRSAMSR